MSRAVPVVDLFAGPGGLSEGFASISNEVTGRPFFSVGVSIEKDPVAARTLELRAFFRSFEGKAPDAYYDYIRGRISRDQLLDDPRFTDEAAAARREAVCAELGKTPHEDVDKLIRDVVAGTDQWV